MSQPSKVISIGLVLLVMAFFRSFSVVINALFVLSFLNSVSSLLEVSLLQTFILLSQWRCDLVLNRLLFLMSIRLVLFEVRILVLLLLVLSTIRRDFLSMNLLLLVRLVNQVIPVDFIKRTINLG